MEALFFLTQGIKVEGEGRVELKGVHVKPMRRVDPVSREPKASRVVLEEVGGDWCLVLEAIALPVKRHLWGFEAKLPDRGSSWYPQYEYA